MPVKRPWSPGTATETTDAFGKAEVSTCSTTPCSSDDDIRKKLKVFHQDAKDLPVRERKSEILRAVRKKCVTILVGETGSGKSTQVPQMLLELEKVAEYVAVTQPRRLAATTLADRVATELKEENEHSFVRFVEAFDENGVGRRVKEYDPGGVVGYHVRFKKLFSSATKLKFMTDGILIREALADPLLTRYSCVVVDEVHERSARTDVLLGILHRIVTGGKRPDFRVVLMSATINYAQYIEFFGSKNCATVLVPGRQHSVTVLHLSQPCPDYFEGALASVMQLHFTRPPGDILVFMPGQEEIELLCTSIRQKQQNIDAFMLECTKKFAEQFSAAGSVSTTDKFTLRTTLVAEVEEVSSEKVEYESIAPRQSKTLRHLTSASRIRHQEFSNTSVKPVKTEIDAQQVMRNFSFHALPQPQSLLPIPLYAALSYEAQQRAFEPAEKGVRKVIVSTNVAETSITLPGVRYVVDTGVYKVKTYDPRKRLEVLAIKKICRAMANQRSGRAGREAPGEAYRLYTDQSYQDMETFGDPEIKRTNLSQVLLELLILGVTQISTFPFPSRPSNLAIEAAIQELVKYGALDAECRITKLGRFIQNFPVAPELGAFLHNSIDHGCLNEALILSAILSSDPVWLSERAFADSDRNFGGSALTRKCRMCLLSTHGDHVSLLNAYSTWLNRKQRSEQKKFCSLMRLSHRSLCKARDIYHQLLAVVKEKLGDKAELSSCGDSWDKLLTCLAVSFPHKTARLVNLTLVDNAGGGRKSQQGKHEGSNQTPSAREKQWVYLVEDTREVAWIHPTSVFFGRQEKPKRIVFFESVETHKIMLRTVSAIGDHVDHVMLKRPKEVYVQRLCG